MVCVGGKRINVLTVRTYVADVAVAARAAGVRDCDSKTVGW